MQPLVVNVGQTPYPLYIERGGLHRLPDKIREILPGARIAVVSDETVYGILGERVMDNLKQAGIDAHSVVLPPGEGTKSLPVLSELYEKMVAMGMTRTDGIVALGGGVIGDLTGVLAATYLRGVPFIQVPTTLLSQIDSSIGGKTAVNLPSGKNLVGAFYHPRMVMIDPDVLDTLSDADFAGGMAEIIKTGCILDRELFEIIEANAGREAVTPLLPEIIGRCCDIKRRVVEADERDTGERLLLNFGHTLAHALEKCGDPPLTHGQAVAVGMAHMTRMSEGQGLTRAGAARRIEGVLAAFGLPTALPEACGADTLMAFAGRDKKIFSGKLRIILLRSIGEAFIHPVDPADFARFLGGDGREEERA